VTVTGFREFRVLGRPHRPALVEKFTTKRF